ncbi:MAG: porin, partial [Xanthobacteraceae bacterium]
KPAEYVKICSAYGAGFYYIPGTDTCLKVGGFVQVDAYVQDFPDFAESSYADSYFKARGSIRLDARTQTEYGLLRSFIDLRATYGDSGAGDGNYASGTGINLDKGYIQFAGFTFGKVQSFFDFYADNNIWGFDSPAITADSNSIAIAYTFDFGNGFSATVSIEDDSNRTSGLYNTGPYFDPVSGAPYFAQGTDIPALIANIAYEGEWGGFKLSAMVREIDTDTNLNDFDEVLPTGTSFNDDYGYAFLAGVVFNLPALGEGDTLYIEGTWANGAVQYTGASGGLIGQGADQYYDASTNEFNASQAWSIAAELTHYFTPSLFGVLYGGYANLDTQTPGYLDFDEEFDIFAGYDTWTVGGSLNWSPVKNLVFVAQYTYSQYDYDDVKYGGYTYSTDDTDAQQFILSVRRSF